MKIGIVARGIVGANINQLPLLVPFDFYGIPLPFTSLDGSLARAIRKIK
tara:strand:- start:317 stop:463 length:147 start_codon:yes stop_codon:yes gene_type:complete